MKTKNLLYGCALALSITLGLATSPAYAYNPAQQMTCLEGNNPPTNGLAAIGINRADLPPSSQYDTCTLGNIEATGDVILTGFAQVNLGNVTADNGKIGLYDNLETNAGNLTAATNILVSLAHNLGTVTAGTSGSGEVDIYGIADLSVGAISNANGWIFVSSLGTIQTPSITNQNGDIRVFANYQQSSGDPQTIGSGGIGTIINNGDYGFGIYVSNPYGIDYNGTNLLQVQAASGNAGAIILDTGHWTGASPDGTNTGTVTLSGSINADGASGAPAGNIYVFAAEIEANDITLSASSAGAQVGAINLVTNSLVDSGGLTINLNGNNDSAAIDLNIWPIGSFGVAGASYPGLPVFFTDYANSANPLTISGSGDLTITANGNNNQLRIIGYPLTMSGRSGATTTITQQGNGDGLFMFSSDGGDLYEILTFDGTVELHENTTGPGATNLLDVRGTELAPLTTGHVLLDTSGTAGGDGGDINLPFDTGVLTLGATGNNVAVNADGSSSGGKGGAVHIGNGGDLALTLGDGVSASATGGNGDGGSITFSTSSVEVGSGSTSAIATDGHGTGNGGVIQLFADSGDLSIGTASDSVHFSSKGGATSGNGGDVTLQVYNSNLTLNSQSGSDTFNVDAGGDGDGGTVTISALTLSNASGASSTLQAQGNGSGKGGTITISVNGNIDLGGDTTSLTIKADALGTGNGGEFTLNAEEVTVDGAYISVSAGSNGDGGKLNFNSWTLNNTSGAATSFDLNGNGSGKGGEITVVISDDINISGDSTGIAMHTDATGTGSGGTIDVTANTVTIDSADISVNAGTNGNGGTLTVHAVVDINLTGSIAAEGNGSGNGGEITLAATGDLVFTGTGQSLSVNALGTGDPGTIDISSNDHVTVDGGSGEVDLSATNTCSGCFAARAVTSKLHSLVDPKPTITVAANSGPVAINGAHVHTDPGTNRAGPKIVGSSATSLTLIGTLNANGNGTANGGEITLTAGTFVDLSNGNLQAKGGATSGDGGSIIVESNLNGGADAITFGGTINADGGGTGKGGTIHLITNGVKNNPAGAITAKGGLNGDGGRIEIDDTINFNVNSILKVDAGSNINGPYQNDGTVKLNSIPCNQHRTAYNDSFTSYWSCGVDPGADATIAAPAHSLTPFLGLLNSTHIYGFTNVFDFNKFFTTNAPTAGVLGAGSTPINVAAAFQKSDTGTDITGYMDGTIEHELSHILDDNWGSPSAVPGPGIGTYGKAIDDDIANINNQPCTTFFTLTFCNANPGTNWQLIGTKLPTNTRELWAYAFQLKAGGATFSLLTTVETYMTKQLGYMDHLWIAGHP